MATKKPQDMNLLSTMSALASSAPHTNNILSSQTSAHAITRKHRRFITNENANDAMKSSDPAFESSFPQTTKSVPIHIEGMRRTPSEVQLLHDEAIADHRDYCMFARIVSGIRQHRPTDQTVNNIIRTRTQPVEEMLTDSFRSEGCYQQTPKTNQVERDLESMSLSTGRFSYQRDNTGMPTTIVEHDDDDDDVFGRSSEGIEDDGIFFIEL